MYVLINCSLVASALLLTAHFAPAAAGSGIPEVKAYLNGINVPGIFLWQTLLVKLLGSVGAVAGGLAVGKEGPFVHAGACIAALLCQVGITCILSSATQSPSKYISLAVKSDFEEPS